VGGDAALATGAVRDLEETTAARFPEALAVIAHERMNSERRALRIRVQKLEHDSLGGVLRLRFELAAGSFATTVLREIIAAGAGE
jgi:tRNA pseudouridine13 synthase